MIQTTSMSLILTNSGLLPRIHSTTLRSPPCLWWLLFSRALVSASRASSYGRVSPYYHRRIGDHCRSPMLSFMMSDNTFSRVQSSGSIREPSFLTYMEFLLIKMTKVRAYCSSLLTWCIGGLLLHGFYRVPGW